MSGEIGILNVSDGDTKLSFDPKDKAGVKRASATVKDMLRRGYAILVEVGRDDKGPLYRRADDFDPETAEYIIIGAPEEGPESVKPAAAPRRSQASGKGKTEPDSRGRQRGRGPRTRIPATAAKAVAVPRTAGG